MKSIGLPEVIKFKNELDTFITLKNETKKARLRAYECLRMCRPFLKEQQYYVLKMQLLDDYSVDQISKRMGIERSKVMRIANSALETLQKVQKE